MPWVPLPGKTPGPGILTNHFKRLVNATQRGTFRERGSFTLPGASPTTIQVPGGGWYKQGFTTITQADYQRTITIPNSGQPQITRLELGAVNYEADVYINNSLVGTNISSFTPSSFDLSGFVTPGQNYTLKITVKGRMAFMVNGKNPLFPMPPAYLPTPRREFSDRHNSRFIPTAYISDEFVRSLGGRAPSYIMMSGLPMAPPAPRISPLPAI